ncbi:MAG: PAS-domain containing protein, partial [Rhizobiaceae bacterium]|nr:PAS-domain containing protein [Rhizobiaceae bacterium]
NRNRSFILSGNSEHLADYNRMLLAIPVTMAIIKTLTAEIAVQRPLVAKLEKALSAKLEHQANVLRLYRQFGYEGVKELLVSDNGTERLEVLRNQISAMRSAEYLIATRNLAEFRDRLLLQLAIILSFVLCGGIWMSMLSFTAFREILMPVKGMINHVNRIAANDAVEDLPVLRNDEIGELAIHINLMTKKLREARAARQLARAELAAGQQNLVDAVEAMNDGFATFDAEGLLVISNKKYLEIYPEIADIAVPGVSCEALLRRRAEFGREPEAKGRTEEWISEKLDELSNAANSSEFQLIDGRIIRKSQVRTRNGGIVGVYMDITLLKNTEVALRTANRELDKRVTKRTRDLDVANQQLERLNAELSTLIRSAPVAIMAINVQGNVTIWNPAANQLTGYSWEEAQQKFPQLTSVGGKNEFNKLLSRARQGENFSNVELELTRRDGLPFIANIAAAALWDSRGKLHGAIITLVDLTESRALQEQFQQSQKMEVVAELTAGVAHDFNNLLGIIISNLDMLESRVEKNSFLAELVGAALRASLSGVALNRQLLAFSHRQKLSPQNVDISKTIEELKPLIFPILGEHIDCRLKIEKDLWTAIIDPSLLESALLNLAVNARDAMPDEGTFTILAKNKTVRRNSKTKNSELTGDCVVISVSDTGSGMNAKVAARAYEPFFTTKEFGKGSGLGLSMVYGFVRQSGGVLEIDSTPGHGTTVTICIPRSKTSPDMVSGKVKSIETDEVAGSETILVVEDNDALRLAVVRQLQEMGYKTQEADCAKPALKILETETEIDLMLTDIVMPGGMDGRALAGEAAKIRMDMPVLFTTGFPVIVEGDEDANNQSNKYPVLAKPVRRNELAKHIREALKASA